MYLPTHFDVKDEVQLFALVEQFPLAALIRHHDLEISHLPFRLNHETRLLEAHMPRANPLSERSGVPVTLIFQGENGYISPGWYATKAKNPKVVPTWNYAVVHVRGTLRLIDDPSWLATHLNVVTNEHEAAVGGDWRVSDAPTEFTDQLISTLVGIQVEVESIKGKFKLSQNRSAADTASVRTALGAQADTAALARRMSGGPVGD